MSLYKQMTLEEITLEIGREFREKIRNSKILLMSNAQETKIVYEKNDMNWLAEKLKEVFEFGYEEGKNYNKK